MTLWQDSFILWAALATTSLVIWVTIATIVGARQKPHYRRSRVYGVWPRQREFRVRGIVTLDEVASLIGFLEENYGAAVIAHDPEPDETMWLLGGSVGRIEVYFDDHEQTRIRSVKNGGRLFDRLVRDIRQKSSLLF